MSARKQESIRIAAEPGTVCDIVADVESYPEWSADVRSVTVLSEDADSWPQEVEFTIDAGPVSDTYVLAYDWQLAEDGVGEVTWHLVRSSKLKALDGRYVIAREGDGTLVTYDLAVDLAVPLPGMLRRKAEKTIVTTALGGLKARAEG